MKKRLAGFVLLALLITAGSGLAANVTFQVYTSLMQELGYFDPATDQVVVRGSMNGWVGNDYVLTEVPGGDYGLFSGTFDLADDNYMFKYVIVTGEEDRWEDNVDNRTFDVAGEDIVLDPVWFDDGDGTQTSLVTFQVYMSFQRALGNFDPDNGDFVIVRGDFNDWGGDDYALALTDDENNDSLYTGTFELLPGNHHYKFLIGHTDLTYQWEGDPDREFDNLGQDLTLDVVWFNRLDPTPLDNFEVYFQVDMSVAIDGGIFNPLTDGLVIRGNYAEIGNWGGYDVPLSAEGASDLYTVWVQFADFPLTDTLEYKYVVDPGNDGEGNEVWESTPNRHLAFTGDEEDSDQNGYKEVELDPVFFQDNPGNIASDVTVTFVLNSWPAWQKFVAEGIDGIDAIESFWIAGFSPDVNIGWAWGAFPPHAQLLDDGNPPDETAGDRLYTVQLTFPADSPVNQVYKYGINMNDNEAGIGENHAIALDDAAQTMTVIDTFGTVGSQYDGYLDINEIGSKVTPSEFRIEQNYPNPFNPTTMISFTLPEAGMTSFTVFNIMGQEVFRHEAGFLGAGMYELNFNGDHLASGIYVYRIESGMYSATRKMTLLK